MVSKVIYVKSRFPAFHRWVDAPKDVGFLRCWHRHMFHVKVGLDVDDSNRELEFFTVKKDLDVYIGLVLAAQHFEYSCEQIAEKIMKHMKLKYKDKCVFCEVNEDNENGAIVSYL